MTETFPPERHVAMELVVYLNQSLDFLEYHEGDRLLKAIDMRVAARPEDIPRKLLDAVFLALNIDEPDPDWARIYREHGGRSLSVGDVVSVGEMAYACDRVGWRPVSITADQIIIIPGVVEHVRNKRWKTRPELEK